MKKRISVSGLNKQTPLEVACTTVVGQFHQTYRSNYVDLYNTGIKGSQHDNDGEMAAVRAILNHLATTPTQTLEQWRNASGKARKVILNGQLEALQLPQERWARHLIKLAIPIILEIDTAKSDFKSEIQAVIESKFFSDPSQDVTLGMRLTFKEVYVALNPQKNYEDPQFKADIDHQVRNLLDGEFCDYRYQASKTPKTVRYYDQRAGYERTRHKEGNQILIAVVLQALGLDLGAYHTRVVDSVLLDFARHLKKTPDRFPNLIASGARIRVERESDAQENRIVNRLLELQSDAQANRIVNRLLELQKRQTSLESVQEAASRLKKKLKENIPASPPS